jgi:hypothetical protein
MNFLAWNLVLKCKKPAKWLESHEQQQTNVIRSRAPYLAIFVASAAAVQNHIIYTCHAITSEVNPNGSKVWNMMRI